MRAVVGIFVIVILRHFSSLFVIAVYVDKVISIDFIDFIDFMFIVVEVSDLSPYFTHIQFPSKSNSNHSSPHSTLSHPPLYLI